MIVAPTIVPYYSGYSFAVIRNYSFVTDVLSIILGLVEL